MQLKNMIEQVNDLRSKRQMLQAQDNQLKQELERLEADIKSLANDMGHEMSDMSEQDFQSLLAEIGDTQRITIEVVFAENRRQLINELQVPHGATIEDGIMLSGILDDLPGVSLESHKVGIYGMVKPLSETLHDGDRIEIYRPVNG